MKMSEKEFKSWIEEQESKGIKVIVKKDSITLKFMGKSETLKKSEILK